MAFTYILPYLQEIDDMELRPRCRRKSLESGKQKETQRSLKSKQKNKAWQSTHPMKDYNNAKLDTQYIQSW